MSPDFGEVALCMRYLMRPSIVLPSHHESKRSRSDPFMGYLCPSAVAGLLLLQVPRESNLSFVNLVWGASALLATKSISTLLLQVSS